jgi:hypothetical protein
MKTNLLKCLLMMMLTVAPLGVRATDEGALSNLDLTKLEKLASERVTVSLDKPMIEFAAKLLPKDDQDTQKLQTLIKNLDGIYVRVFSFADQKTYSESDVDALRKQLGTGWSRLVEVRGEDNVDFYVKRDGEKIKGFVLIAAEPLELTLVNIQGSIRPEQLNELEGFAGIPRGIFKPGKEKGEDKVPVPKDNDNTKK